MNSPPQVPIHDCSCLPPIHYRYCLPPIHDCCCLPDRCCLPPIHDCCCLPPPMLKCTLGTGGRLHFLLCAICSSTVSGVGVVGC